MRTSRSWRVPKKVTPETSVKNQIKQYLAYKGFFIFPVLQGLGAYKGISDYIAMKEGCGVLFIEVKRPAGVQSEHQIEFQRKVEAAGQRYIVARSIDDLIKVGI